MTATDPTPLAEQIAWEHRIVRCPVHDAPDCSVVLNGCTLPARLYENALHIATVTEQAVRERVAAEIEAAKSSHAFRNATLDRAARIARGGTHA
jgi:hypothetical protein